LFLFLEREHYYFLTRLMLFFF